LGVGDLVDGYCGDEEVECQYVDGVLDVEVVDDGERELVVGGVFGECEC